MNLKLITTILALLAGSLTASAQGIMRATGDIFTFPTNNTVAGMTHGQRIIALDSQMSTGVLYALGYDSVKNTTQLYRLTHTGSAFTAQAVAPPTAAMNLGASTNLIFDFMPRSNELIQVIGSNGNRYVINSTDGTVTTGRKPTYADNNVVGNDPRNKKLLLYPNPVIYMTNIQLPFAMTGTVYVDINDMAGRNVHKSYDVYWSNTVTVDMSSFPPGQYVMKISAVNLGIHSLKVEKQ
ncbi:MAG: hypothetical protein K0Q79_2165 [Flavipsychrobacter sp.]|nr:hypothetical protein [Flavipsychrobacter sp.]